MESKRFNYIVNPDYVNGDEDHGVKFAVYNHGEGALYFIESYDGKHEKDKGGRIVDIKYEDAFIEMYGEGAKATFYDDFNNLKVTNEGGSRINYAIRKLFNMVAEMGKPDMVQYIRKVYDSLWGEAIAVEGETCRIINKSIVGGDTFYIIRKGGKVIFRKKDNEDIIIRWMKIIE